MFPRSKSVSPWRKSSPAVEVNPTVITWYGISFTLECLEARAEARFKLEDSVSRRRATKPSAPHHAASVMDLGVPHRLIDHPAARETP